MTISHVSKFIYIHVPKCAGFTVDKHLADGAEILEPLMWTTPSARVVEPFHKAMHGTWRDALAKYGSTVWREYFKFSFVRNPFARVVSAFFFLQRGGVNDNDKAFVKQHQLLERTGGDFTKFVHEFVATETFQHLFHIQPASDFVCDGNKICLDFVGRVETIEKDLKTVLDRLRIPFESVAHLNKSESKEGKKHWSSYYDDATRKIVERRYALDLEIFDYRFDRG